MNNKIVKTIDEHNIDRDANVMFAFDLEGSDYVSYRISRDEEQDNLFVSKVIKNIDNTYNMVNVEDSTEKSKLNSIVMALVEGAVKNPADKLVGDSVTLSDGKVIKFIAVNFNKEQKIEVKKTYVTTVKKEVSRVAEKYYAVEVEQPKVEEIFPAVTPVVTPIQEEVKVAEPVVVSPVVESPVVQPTPVVAVESVPTVVEPITMPDVSSATNIIAQPLQSSVQAQPQEVIPTPVVAVEPAPTVVEPIAMPTAIPTVVEPVSQVVTPTPVVPEPVLVTPEPVPAAISVTESQPLVFNASKETNLNAALGEVANSAGIPVENIQPVREFGVDAPVQTPVQQPAVAPMVQPEVAVAPKTLTKKAGFANSKFFMLVAIAFFLASCIFLGYEVFNYFQLTK